MGSFWEWGASYNMLQVYECLFLQEITKEASVVNVDPELWEQLNGKDIQLQV